MKKTGYYRLFFVITFFFCLISTGELRADLVHLRAGGAVLCYIQNQDSRMVLCKLPQGKILQISKSDIIQIYYGPIDQKQKKLKRRLELEQNKHAARRRARLRIRRQKEWERAETARLQAEKLRQARIKERALGNLWRSSLLPGLGQSYRGDGTRPYVLGGGFLVLGGGLLYLNNTHRIAERSYEQSVNEGLLAITVSQPLLSLYMYERANTRQVKMERVAKRYYTGSVLLLGVYLYNLLDAYFLTGEAPPPAGGLTEGERPGHGLILSGSAGIVEAGHPGLSPSESEIYLGYRLTF